jgi:hypothetical protein
MDLVALGCGPKLLSLFKIFVLCPFYMLFSDVGTNAKFIIE